MSLHCLSSFFLFAAYETLSDKTRRRDYDRFSDTSAHFSGRYRQAAHQRFTFNFDDVFKDFDIHSQIRHSNHRRHFDDHSRSHKEAHGSHKRQFRQSFGADTFEDMFEDLERMFTFDRNSKQGENRFHGAQKQHCRTVTQRRGNMVTTYTDCTAS